MPSNIELSAFQSPYEYGTSTPFDAYGNLPSSATEYSFTPSASASGMTEKDASGKMGEAIQEMPSFGSDFVQGMKLGYMGTQTLTAPFLAYRKAKQQKTILGLQQELLEMQAKSYQTAAEDVMRAGHNASGQVSFQIGQAKASARASTGARGVRIGVGSSAEVLASYDIAKEMQTNQIISNAITQSWGYRRQAVNVQNQALAVESAKNSISPWAAAVTTFISTSLDALNSVGTDFGNGEGGVMNGQTWKNFANFWK